MNTSAQSPEPTEPETSVPDPRRLHYGEFYQLRAPARGRGGPTVAVVGNCQAESLRILLDSTGGVDSFRIPAIHEWTAEDVELMGDVLATTDVLVMQPVRDDYRGLPSGTDQLAALLPVGGRVVTYPVLRFDGLMPYQAIVRSPVDPSLNPPVVPYHDLRILVAASRDLDSPVQATPSDDVLRELATLSIAELRLREQAHHTVVVSDHLETTPVWHTINHPDNSTLIHLAHRVLEAIGVRGQVRDPGRELLGNLDAPVDPQAAHALGVEVEGRQTWRPSPAEDIAQAQLGFYREHPEVVDAGLTRHARRLQMLGLL